MFKHILIPTDGHLCDARLFLWRQLAEDSGAKVTGLTVAEPYDAASMDAVLIPLDEGDYEEQSRLLSEKAIEQVKMAADAAGVPCERSARSMTSLIAPLLTPRMRSAAILSSWPRMDGVEFRPAAWQRDAPRC